MDRRQSRSANAHAKDQDRKKVETDVHEGGQEQEVDRCLAVAQTSDDARQHVIEVCDRDSKEDHKNVIIGAWIMSSGVFIHCKMFMQSSPTIVVMTTANTAESHPAFATNFLIPV